MLHFQNKVAEMLSNEPKQYASKIIPEDTNFISITLLSLPLSDILTFKHNACADYMVQNQTSMWFLRSENCTQFLTTSLHLKMHFESRRINPVGMEHRLRIVYVQTVTSSLNQSTSTSCYTSLKVVSCEEVTTSCCVGCVQT